MLSSSSSTPFAQRLKGLGFRVWGLGFRVWDLGFRVWGLGFQVQGIDGTELDLLILQNR